MGNKSALVCLVAAGFTWAACAEPDADEVTNSEPERLSNITRERERPGNFTQVGESGGGAQGGASGVIQPSVGGSGGGPQGTMGTGGAGGSSDVKVPEAAGGSNVVSGQGTPDPGSTPTVVLTEPEPPPTTGEMDLPLLAKVIKTKVLIADVVYTKQIKLAVFGSTQLIESKQEGRYERAKGSGDLVQPDIRASVIYAEDIEAYEVRAKQVFAQKIQNF